MVSKWLFEWKRHEEKNVRGANVWLIASAVRQSLRYDWGGNEIII